MSRRICMIALVCLLYQGRGKAQEVTLQYVLERMAAYERMKAETLRTFAVDRFYSIENRRVNKRASLNVTVTCIAPSERLFRINSFSGSAFMRKNILERLMAAEKESAKEPVRAQVAISPANYRFTLLREETVQGRRQYVLRTSALRKEKLLFNGTVWVDAEDFAITRIEGSPARNPSFWTRQVDFVHEYGKTGPYWLSLRNTSVTKAFIFGRTTTLVEYGNYRINEPGLPGGQPD